MLRDVIKRLLEHEAQALVGLTSQIDAIIEVASLCAACRGRIIVTGIGKSGIAARKIAGTLTSIGAPAIFLHPTEALHGELGIISADDVALCVSKSGRTEELGALLAFFKRWGLPVVAITADANSPLAREADITVVLPTAEEGEPLGIIPTTSVVASIAVGDAVAAALVKMQGLTKEQFREFHPGGAIGQRLMKVRDLMHTGEEIPIVPPSATLRDAIVEITRKRLGTTLIVDGERIVGIITDGDVRRAIQRDPNPLEKPATDFATPKPKTISPNALAEEALSLMEQNKITSLVVVDGEKLVGFIHMHDILQRKIV